MFWIYIGSVKWKLLCAYFTQYFKTLWVWLYCKTGKKVKIVAISREYKSFFTFSLTVSNFSDPRILAFPELGVRIKRRMGDFKNTLWYHENPIKLFGAKKSRHSNFKIYWEVLRVFCFPLMFQLLCILWRQEKIKILAED